MKQDMIVILDLGSTENTTLARAIRELGVYSEIYPHDILSLIHIWSDPVFVKQGGIDPSLFWDEDGTVYFQSTHSDGAGSQCIGQCTIDIETGETLTPTRPIWYGTGGKCPEGPHLYKIGGYYYLMIAEGGTEYGHMETIARSCSPWGPFESCPCLLYTSRCV